MSNQKPRTVDSRHKRDEALNLADFKIDDILNVPADRLLAEVAEDFGDPAFLAVEFDSIALPVMSSYHDSAVNPDEAAAASPVRQATPDIASFGAFYERSPATKWSFQRALLASAQRLRVPLRGHALLAGCAALLLVTVLAPGLYRLLVEPLGDQMAAAPQGDPSRHSQMPTALRPSTATNPAPAGSAEQTPAASTPLAASL